MLLGLLAAVMLAVLLQLSARRLRRPGAFEFAADGVIHLKAWVVVEAPMQLAAWPVLALPAPARRAPPLRFVGEARMLRRPPVRQPRVRTPPDAIIIPAEILPALVAAREISASIWQSPPGHEPNRSLVATLH